MAGKEVHSDDDLQSYHGHLSVTERLQELINQLDEALGPDHSDIQDDDDEPDESSHRTICERLDELIQMHSQYSETEADVSQTGNGEIKNSAEPLPDTPMGLSQTDVDK